MTLGPVRESSAGVRPRSSVAPSGSVQDVLASLQRELGSSSPVDMAPPTTGAPAEGLYERVARVKALWLKRVMYDSPATSTQKCLAYAIADHLNCVTLDAWPGMAKLSRRLGFMAEKTVRRAAQGLEAREFLIVTNVKQMWRFAPVFSPDEDKVVFGAGHSRSRFADRNVPESYLSIHTNKSAPTAVAAQGQTDERFDRKRRGAVEIKIAEWLGPDGVDVLDRLALIGDEVVDLLCRAYVEGTLTDREKAAARLAAQQVQR